MRILLIALLVFQQPAITAVIVVDGTCTLADAVSAANTDTAVGSCSAGSGTDRIQLTTDVSLTAELPDVVSDIVLDGNDHTIERDAGAPTFRLFHVQGASFTLLNATLTNGDALSGGAIRAVGSELRIDDSILIANSASSAGGAISIENMAYGVIENSTVSNNSSSGSGGGISTQNEAHLLLINSSIVDNSAVGDGGGIYTGWYSTMAAFGSTIAGNSGYNGSGVAALHDADTTLVNTTISGNTGSGFGGVYSGYYTIVELLNSSVIGNSNHNLYSGFLSSGPIYVTNSLLAEAQPPGNFNCFGISIIDGVGNFDDDRTCPDASPITSGIDVEPTLADNGGPTDTHALLPGSAAIDASTCGSATDQRGFLRDALCDAGSFELGAVPSGVGGFVGDMTGRRVRCRNLTTSQSVVFDLAGAAGWDCEDQGLIVSSGDSVRQSVVGLAAGGAAGGALGIDPAGLICHNITTGESVSVAMPAALWDCEADGGLTVDPGDRVEQVFRGRAE